MATLLFGGVLDHVGGLLVDHSGVIRLFLVIRLRTFIKPEDTLMLENKSTKEVLMRRKSFRESSTTTGELIGFTPGNERVSSGSVSLSFCTVQMEEKEVGQLKNIWLIFRIKHSVLTQDHV